MMHKSVRLVLSIAIVLASFVVISAPAPVSAAALTVGGGGTYATIQAAINNASPGDTIQVRAGTYNENLNLSLMGSAIAGTTGNLAIVKDGAGTVTIGGTGVKLTNSGAFNGGLTVDGLSFASTTDNRVIQLTNLTGLTFVNNIVNGSGTDFNNSHGLYVAVSSGSGNYNIANNTFNSGIVADGIRIDASGGTPNFTITGNTFNGGVNMNYGIEIISTNAAAVAATVMNNTFVNPFTGGLIFDSRNTSTFTGYAASNTFSNFSQASSIGLGTYAGDTSTMNLTLTGNQTSGTFEGRGLEVNMFAGATVNGTVSNNVMAAGTSAGPPPLDAIAFLGTNTPTSVGTVQFINNTVTAADGAGIYVRALGMNPAPPNPTYNVTLNGNSISGVNTGAHPNRAGIYVAAGESAGDAGTIVQVNLNGNTVGATGIKLAQVSATACHTGTDAAGATKTGTWSTCGSTPGTPPAQTPPTAANDTASANSAVATTIAVLTNDSNVAALTSFTNPSIEGGTVTRDDNGTPGNQADDRLIYTSLSGFSGTDRFFYTVRSSDNIYASAVVNMTVVVDNTPPDTTITSNPPNPSTSTSATFVFTGTDNITPIGSLTFQCSLDGAAFSTCTSPITYTSLADGLRTFQVRARDQAGNVDLSPASYSWTIDTTLPDLQLTKSDGNLSATPGSVLTYTLTYTNAGTKNATGVVLTETVPANTTFNAGASTAGWACTPNSNAGSTCTLSVGTLITNTSGSAAFAVTVANPVAAGVAQLNNTASVADDGTHGADPTPGNNSASDTTPIIAAPDLSLTKTDGGISTTPGGVVTYTLIYTNAGDQNATGVVLTETVPANTTYTGSGWTCAPNNNAGSTCTLALGALAGGNAGGSAAFVVTVVNPAPAGVAQVSNTATIADDGSNGADSTPGNNSASDTTPIDAAPDLKITKDDAGVIFLPGTNITYTIAYTNAGNQAATGVVLTDVVPANTTYLGTGWTCTPNNNAGSVCSRAVGNFAVGAGGSATFIVNVNNPAPGVTVISNTALIGDDGSNGADLNPGDNSATQLTPIANQPPTILSVNVAPNPVAEMGVVTVTGTLTDPDALDTHVMVIRWGDSLSTTLNLAAGVTAYSATHQYPDDNPSGTSSDVYTIGLTLSDPIGNFDTDSATVTVNNVAPTLSNVAAISPINESSTTQLTGSIGDVGTQDTFTLTVDWGDGSATQTFTYPAGTTAFTRTHQYLDDNPSGTPSDVYSIGLTLTDDDMGSVTATAPVTVTNLPPTLSNVAATSPVNENGTTTLTGSLGDVGTQDTFTLTVDWGDGTHSDFAYSAGTTAFTETHQYLDDKPSGTPSDVYAIDLVLTDDDLGSTTANTLVTVNNVAPTLSNVAATSPVNENSRTTLTGDIADVGTQDTFTLTVDWGDGNTSTFTYPAATTAFTETHQYLDDNPSGTSSDVYPIGLTLADDDTGSTTTGTSVTVDNVAPSVDAGSNRAGVVSQPIVFAGSFTDPGTLDTHTIVWDFGDGITQTGALTPTHVYAQPGVYTVTLTVGDDDTGVGSDQARVTVNRPNVYLPLVARNYVTAPDLVAAQLHVSTGSAQVVIQNQGTQPAVDGFYVDVYINPVPAPTSVNQIWSDGRSTQGLVWGVTDVVQPGQSITLTIGDAYYRPDLSTFTLPVSAGTPVYAQVDSYNPLTTYGGVLENHEISGAPYNNILGPVSATTAFAPLRADQPIEPGPGRLPFRLRIRWW